MEWVKERARCDLKHLKNPRLRFRRAERLVRRAHHPGQQRREGPGDREGAGAVQEEAGRVQGRRRRRVWRAAVQLEGQGDQPGQPRDGRAGLVLHKQDNKGKLSCIVC